MDSIKKWFVRELARSLEISEEAIAVNEPFSRFGLDSAKAVGLLNRLGEFLGRKVPIALAWSYPTIERLSNYLCGNSELKSEVFPRRPFSSPARNQPIAVIGLACRFPGAPDPGAFWELLRSGRSAIRGITPDRWNIEAWYDPDPNKPGKMNAAKAGLLECIDRFDPGFFGISPREAILMDPQQRLALELVWEALENAGIRPTTLRGSPTGVFVGVVWHDYETLARKAGAEITLHSGTGQAFSIVANRISYALGLQGPSIALDTACSSSLVSVHLACRCLQSGDAALAIAGGVNLIIDPDTMVTLSKFGGLSPTSQLFAFDARANGFVRGEGGGFVVLKPLGQALADGDPIYAVIRGTAANNDGASNGLTAPNPRAQEAVMRRAYTDTDIRTADVHYLEAHGTGTQLGDPIEAQALREVFGNERAEDQPLLIGSVKTNIGHLEGAAGIAGLIKLVLSINQRLIPPSLNFQVPNPHIDFGKLRVVTQLEPWPEPDKPAVGAVSAFGWGGTNCHVVVEEIVRSKAHLLPLSAPDSTTLTKTAAELRSYLSTNSSSVSLPDLCATGAARCTAQPERVALTARSLNELGDQLEGFLQGQKRPGLATGHDISHRPKLAFVFSPQGSQWIGMGRSLLAVEPVFRAKLVECDRALTKLAGWSLFELLLSTPEPGLNGVEVIQPALAAIQIALAELWNSWGVRPDFVAAHSLGEWAAACVAGTLSAEETMRIVVQSSRAQSQAGPGGGMAIVELPAAEVIERIRQLSGEVFIAGENSPSSTVLSGDAGHLNSLIATWKNEGLTCSLIDVDVAAHSPCVDSVLTGLITSLSGLHPTRTAIPLISSITGGRILGPELGPEHWARHLRQPVLFTQVIEHLVREGCTIFLEISPHPLLTGAIAQTLSALGSNGTTLGSCRRGADERESLLTSLGTLYSLGWPIEWDAVTHGGQKDLALPVSVRSEQVVSSAANPRETPWLLPLSSHTTAGLRDRARSVANCLQTNPAPRLDDIVYTLGAGREHLGHRLAVVGTDPDKITSTLATFAKSQDLANPDAIVGRARPNGMPRVAFVCSGQGPQWQGMGRELVASVPVFRREIARCAEEIKRHTSWDLLQELERDEADSRLHQTEIAQPALFALQVALAAIWRSWGIVPDLAVGHSAGEIAAAHLSGVLSFEDAVMLICHRGRLMQQVTGLGRMAALEISEPEAEELVQLHGDRISIAAVNSPTSIVVSGPTSAIEQIVKVTVDKGVRAKILPVDYAFHSYQMEPIRLELAECISGIKPQVPSIPLYSTVTGAQSTGKEFDIDYWGRNIRSTVRFASAVQAMLDAGTDIFLELSPQPVLSGMIAQCAEASSKPVQQLTCLRRGVSDRLQLFRSLAALFAAGREVDWMGVYPKTGRVVQLPNYPWQRKRYWLEMPLASPRPGGLAEQVASAKGEQGSLAAEAQSPEDLLFEVVWQPCISNAEARTKLGSAVSDQGHAATASTQVPSEAPSATLQAGAWLVLGEESPLCEAIVDSLAKQGIEILRVDRDREFALLNPRHCKIEAAQPEQIGDAILAVLASAKLPVRRAVCLWGVTPEPGDSEELYQQAITLCSQALFAAQTLVSRARTPYPSFWLVTCGAQSPRTSEKTALSTASLWGLSRVLAVEHPEIWGGALDLDPAASPEEQAETVIAQIETPDGENQCSFREGHRFVPRLIPQPKLASGETKVDWSAAGCYLITGGFGGIGLHLARWLADQGARKIVLVGRTGLPPRSSWQSLEPASRMLEQVSCIREIETKGTAVKTVAFDIADDAQIRGLLKSLAEEGWLPVLGVIHAAAVAEAKLAQQLDSESLARVFRPKALGALTLEKCLEDQPLQFFICCSSLGSQLGQIGQASYAAANAFLDAFVQHRRATKRPALGINWGGWYETGLASTAGGRHTVQSLEQRGMLGLKPAEGLIALKTLLERECTQATVIRIDWARFRQTYALGNQPRLLSGLASSVGLPVLAETPNPTGSQSGLRHQLLALNSGAARRTMLEAHLSNLLAAVLRLDGSTVDVEKPMGSFGLDSLMGSELKNLCEQSLGLALSATIVWNYPTIRTLAGYLAERLGVALSHTPTETMPSKNGAEKPTSESSFSTVLASVEQLSEEDAVNALIAGARN